MFPVTYAQLSGRLEGDTFLIVTAVRTREATASIREERRSKLSRSCSFRITFPAYILAISLFPCWIAYPPQHPLPWARTFLTLAFWASASLWAFRDCRLSILAVIYGLGGVPEGEGAVGP
jgi:hypothetical protein